MNALKIKAVLAQMDEVRMRPLNASRERVLADLRAQVEMLEFAQLYWTAVEGAYSEATA